MGKMNKLHLKWDKKFKADFFDQSCYEPTFKYDFENVTVMAANEDEIKVFAFDDGYEGYEIVLINNDGKIGIKSYREVDDSETN